LIASPVGLDTRGSCASSAINGGTRTAGGGATHVTVVVSSADVSPSRGIKEMLKRALKVAPGAFE
jgi:hypothetical protein